MATRCFWLEPEGHWERTVDVHAACGHRTTLPWQSGEGGGRELREQDSDWDSAPWPTNCAECGAAIDYGSDETHQSMCGHTFYRRADTGEVGEISGFPPGAMWNAPWMTDWYPRPDGRCIVVRLPNGHDWNIDGQASNCDRAEDKNHDCWCRHGEPPDLTVDKNPEPGRSTCTAGGGSIWANQGDPNEWHGFLQRGWLVVVGESPPTS